MSQEHLSETSAAELALTSRGDQTTQASNERHIALTPIDDLKPNPANPRKHPRSQVRAIAHSIQEFGFNAPILTDCVGLIIAGHGRLAAAKLLGLPAVPTLSIGHLSEAKKRAYLLADNKLTDRSSWDDTKLAIQLKELSELSADFRIEATGFEAAEADLRIQSLDTRDPDALDEHVDAVGPAVTRLGDHWILGDHHIQAGDALVEQTYPLLLADKKAAAVFTDPPYNVPINGHVRGKGLRHQEFVMGSKGLSTPEFEKLLTDVLKHCVNHTVSGAVIYSCMDWRHMPEMLTAGRENKIQLLNLCVWVKTNGGMGSLYRSRHELVFVFRNGTAPHTNNIQLGRFGRNRTNVWNYSGANSFARNNSIDAFESHPTVKPVRLVADALLDCSNRGDIVLDPFLGSGTTMLAAEGTGRRCYGIELDPLHVDTAIQRWERMTRRHAVSIQGQTFAEARAARGATS